MADRLPPFVRLSELARRWRLSTFATEHLLVHTCPEALLRVGSYRHVDVAALRRAFPELDDGLVVPVR